MTTDNTPDADDLVETLRDLSPEALPAWSRIVALLVAHKGDLGIGATDAEVAAAAPSLFVALIEVCVEAKRRDDAVGEHRLAVLKWFLGACHAELHGTAERPTLN